MNETLLVEDKRCVWWGGVATLGIVRVVHDASLLPSGVPLSQLIRVVAILCHPLPDTRHSRTLASDWHAHARGNPVILVVNDRLQRGCLRLVSDLEPCVEFCRQLHLVKGNSTAWVVPVVEVVLAIDVEFAVFGMRDA